MKDIKQITSLVLELLDEQSRYDNWYQKYILKLKTMADSFGNATEFKEACEMAYISQNTILKSDIKKHSKMLGEKVPPISQPIDTLINIDEVFGISDEVKIQANVQKKVFDFVIRFLKVDDCWAKDFEWLADFLNRFPISKKQMHDCKFRELLRNEISFDVNEVDYYLDFFEFSDVDYMDKNIQNEVLYIIEKMESDVAYAPEDFLDIFKKYPVVNKGNKEIDKLCKYYQALEKENL